MLRMVLDKFDTIYSSSHFSNLFQVVCINPLIRLKRSRHRNCALLLGVVKTVIGMIIKNIMHQCTTLT